MRFCSLIIHLWTSTRKRFQDERKGAKDGGKDTHLIKSETWSRRMLTDSASMLVWAMKLGRLTVGRACRRKAKSAESGKRSRGQLLDL